MTVTWICCAGSAWGFSLEVDKVAAYYDSQGTASGARRHIPFLDGHAPIHQGLTSDVLRCDKGGVLCEQLHTLGITEGYVQEGVRWNDFPAVYLNKNSAWYCMHRVLRVTETRDVPCIIGSFVRASQLRHRFKERRWALARPFSMRGHFGDLQFLHAMAPDDQRAEETYKHILMWMEFSYRASFGEFDLNSDMHFVPVAGMSSFFVRGARRVGDLLDYRHRTGERHRTMGIALGQMLHIAQDSFAKCHVTRDQHGRVLQFLSYGAQDRDTHAHFDEDAAAVRKATSKRLNPTDFGTRLLQLRVQGARWSELLPLMKEYFEPLNMDARAAPGDSCRRSLPPGGGSLDP